MLLIPTGTTEPALPLATQRRSSSRTLRGYPGGQTRDVLLTVLAERSRELGDHNESVAELAVRTGRGMSLAGESLEHLRRAAELHDVGKVGIPDAILFKPGPLDSVEWESMRTHTIIGERILLSVPSLEPVAKLVRSTHERVDGAGYPDQLAGDDIPLGARIVAVCDAFDAMIGERPYRVPMTPVEALEELKRCAGTQFDPDVVDTFERVIQTDLDIDDQQPVSCRS